MTNATASKMTTEELIEEKNDLLLDLGAACKDLEDANIPNELRDRHSRRIPHLTGYLADLEKQIAIRRMRTHRRAKAVNNFISRAFLLEGNGEFGMAMLSLRWALRLLNETTENKELIDFIQSSYREIKAIDDANKSTPITIDTDDTAAPVECPPALIEAAASFIA